MSEIRFTSVARVNSLYWITSLRDSEQGITRRVLEDLEPHFSEIALPFKKYHPQSRQEFIACLDEIAEDARSGALPFIHLDMHGSAENGLQIAATGEYVSWPAVADKMRIVNIVTENNLCIVSGVCFSFAIVRQIDTKQPAPFYMLFAPAEEIAAGTLEENTLSFYRDVFNHEEIIASQERWFPELSLFHAERMVAVALARYIDMACTGKNAEARKEDLITMAMERGVPNNRANRRKFRKLAEDQIKPSPALIERFTRSFLIGKQVGFTVSQLIELVMDARRAGVPPRPYPRRQN